jgi:hypothetical protein
MGGPDRWYQPRLRSDARKRRVDLIQMGELASSVLLRSSEQFTRLSIVDRRLASLAASLRTLLSTVNAQHTASV